MGFFKKGDDVTTSHGTTGRVVDTMRHPVTRTDTAVVVQPRGTYNPEQQVVVNPNTTKLNNS